MALTRASVSFRFDPVFGRGAAFGAGRRAVMLERPVAWPYPSALVYVHK